MPWPYLKKILRRQANIQLVEGACLIDCTHRLPRAYGHSSKRVLRQLSQCVKCLVRSQFQLFGKKAYTAKSLDTVICLFSAKKLFHVKRFLTELFVKCL